MATISIWGRYHGTGKAEVIDRASSEDEAYKLLNEYRMAYGRGWTIWVGRKDSEPRANNAAR